jgi:ketosteroid isomerase-like protein
MSQNIGDTYLKVNNEAWLKGNLEALDELYDINFVRHPYPFPDTKGLEKYKQAIKQYLGNWSDVELTFHEVIVQGNTIVTRWTWHGTHIQSGKRPKLVGCEIHHMVNGKIVETWEYWDYLGGYRQMGWVSQ